MLHSGRKSLRLSLVAVFAAAAAAPAVASAHNHHHHEKWGYNCVGQVTHPFTNVKIDTVGHLALKFVGHTLVDKFENHGPSGETYRSIGWTHYDKLANNYQRYAIDNKGGASRSVAQPPSGQTFVWNGEVVMVGHKPLTETQTIERTGDGTFNWTVDVTHSGADAVNVYKGQCHRVEGPQTEPGSGDASQQPSEPETDEPTSPDDSDDTSEEPDDDDDDEAADQASTAALYSLFHL